MANNADFYVSFDSDADRFAGKVKEELESAEKAIKGFDTHMKGLQGLGEQLGKQAQAVEGTVKRISGDLKKAGVELPREPKPKPAEEGGSSSPGSGSAKEMKLMGEALNSITTDLNSWRATMEGVFSDLKGALISTSKAQEERARRSRGATDANDYKPRVADPAAYNKAAQAANARGQVNPQTGKAYGTNLRRGNYASPSITEGTVSAREYREQRESSRKASLRDSPSTRHRDTSSSSGAAATINPDSFNALKSAVEEGGKKTVKATREVGTSVDAVKGAIDALAAKLAANAGGAGGAGAGAPATSTKVASSATDTDLAPPVDLDKISNPTLRKKGQKLNADMAKAQAAIEQASSSGDVTVLPELMGQISDIREKGERLTETPAQKRARRKANRDKFRDTPAAETPSQRMFEDMSVAMDIAANRGEVGDQLRGRVSKSSPIQEPKEFMRTIVESFQEAGVDPAKGGIGLDEKSRDAWSKVWNENTGTWRGDGDQGNTKANMLEVVRGLGQVMRLNPLKPGPDATADQRVLADKVNNYRNRPEMVPSSLTDSQRSLIKDIGTGDESKAVSDAFDMISRNAKAGGSTGARGALRTNPLGVRSALAGVTNEALASARDTVGEHMDMLTTRGFGAASVSTGTNNADLKDPLVNPYQRVTGNDTEAMQANRALSKLRQGYDFLDQYPNMMRQASLADTAPKRAEGWLDELGASKAGAQHRKDSGRLAAERLRTQAQDYRVEGTNDDWQSIPREVLAARQAGRTAFAGNRSAAIERQAGRLAVTGAMSDVMLSSQGTTGAARQPIGSRFPGIEEDSSGRLIPKPELAERVKEAAERNARKRAKNRGERSTDEDVRKAERKLVSPLNKARRALERFITTGKTKKPIPKELQQGLDEFAVIADKVAAKKVLSPEEQTTLSNASKLTGKNLRDEIGSRGAGPVSEAVTKDVTQKHLEERMYSAYDELTGKRGLGLRKKGELGYSAPTTQVAGLGGRDVSIFEPGSRTRRMEADRKAQEKTLERGRSNDERRRDIGLDLPMDKEGKLAVASVDRKALGGSVKQMSDSLRGLGVDFSAKVNPEILKGALDGADQMYSAFDGLRKSGKLMLSHIPKQKLKQQHERLPQQGVNASGQAVVNQQVDSDLDRRRANLDARLRERALTGVARGRVPDSPEAGAAKLLESRLSEPGRLRAHVGQIAGAQSQVDTLEKDAATWQSRVDKNQAQLDAIPANKNKKPRRKKERNLSRQNAILERKMAELKKWREALARRQGSLTDYLARYDTALEEAETWRGLTEKGPAKRGAPSHGIKQDVLSADERKAIFDAEGAAKTRLDSLTTTPGIKQRKLDGLGLPTKEEVAEAKTAHAEAKKLSAEISQAPKGEAKPDPKTHELPVDPEERERLKDSKSAAAGADEVSKEKGPRKLGMLKELTAAQKEYHAELAATKATEKGAADAGAPGALGEVQNRRGKKSNKGKVGQWKAQKGDSGLHWGFDRWLEGDEAKAAEASLDSSDAARTAAEAASGDVELRAGKGKNKGKTGQWRKSGTGRFMFEKWVDKAAVAAASATSAAAEGAAKEAAKGVELRAGKGKNKGKTGRYVQKTRKDGTTYEGFDGWVEGETKAAADSTKSATAKTTRGGTSAVKTATAKLKQATAEVKSAEKAVDAAEAGLKKVAPTAHADALEKRMGAKDRLGSAQRKGQADMREAQRKLALADLQARSAVDPGQADALDRRDRAQKDLDAKLRRRKGGVRPARAELAAAQKEFDAQSQAVGPVRADALERRMAAKEALEATRSRSLRNIKQARAEIPRVATTPAHADALEQRMRAKENLQRAQAAQAEAKAAKAAPRPTTPATARSTARAGLAGQSKKVDQDNDVAAIEKVVAAINKLTAVVKAGVPISKMPQKAADAETGLVDAKGNRLSSDPKPVSSIAGPTGRIPDATAGKANSQRRSDYFTAGAREKLLDGMNAQGGKLGDQARAAVLAKDRQAQLAVAAKMVAAGMVRAKEATALFADEVKMSTKDTKAFEKELRQVAAGERALVNQGKNVATDVRKRGQEGRMQATAAERVKGLSAEAHRLGSQFGKAWAKGDQEAIVKGMAKVVAIVKKESAEMGVTTAAGVRRNVQDMLASNGVTNMSGAELKEHTRGISQATGAAAGGPEGAAAAKKSGKSVGQHFGASVSTNAMGTIKRTLFGSGGFWTRTINSAGLFMVRNFAAGMVFGLTNALKEMISAALETEATFVRVSHALEATGRSSDNLRTGLLKISTDYGVGLKDVYDTASGLTGVFDDVTGIEGATRIVTQLQMISNGALNAKEGMGALSSVSAAFGLQDVDSLEHIADVMTVIQQNLGTNLEVSIEGIGSFAGQAVQLGLEVEEASVYVSQIAKMTNAQGAAAGEQFGRILSVMQTGRGQSALRDNYGEEMGAALDTRDYSTALRVLMRDYVNLDKAQQDQVATTLGGSRQMRSLQALLLDGEKVLRTVTLAEEAHGQAEEMAAEMVTKLNRQLILVKTNFEAFGAELVRSGALNVFAMGLKTLNAGLGAVSATLSKMNTFIDDSPLLSSIRNWTGAFAGLLVTVKLVKAAIDGMVASSGKMNAFVLGQGARGGVPGAAGAVGAIGGGRAIGRWDSAFARAGIAAQGGMTYGAAKRSSQWMQLQAQQGLSTFGPEYAAAPLAANARGNVNFGQGQFGPNRFQRSATRWGQRAEQATAARRAAGVGTTPFFLPFSRSYQGQMGDAGQLAKNTSAAAKGATALKAMESGSKGMATAMSKAGQAVAVMSANLGAVTLALGAVGLALLSFYEYGKLVNSLDKETNDIYERNWGANAGKTEEEIAAASEAAKGYQAQADYRDDASKFSFGRIAGGFLAANRDDLHKATFGLFGKPLEESRAGYYGSNYSQDDDGLMVPNVQQKGVNDQRTLLRSHMSLLKKKAGEGYLSLPEVAGQTERMKAGLKNIADSIEGDNSLGETAKHDLFVQLESIEGEWERQIEPLQETVMGVSLLSSDMLNSLQTLLSTVAGADPVALSKSTKGLRLAVEASGLDKAGRASLLNAIGLQPEVVGTSPSVPEEAFDHTNRQLTDKRERLRLTMEESALLLKKAEDKYISEVNTGEVAKIEIAEKDWLAAISSSGAATQAWVESETAAADALSSQRTFRGDYKGAAAALQRGARVLEGNAAELGEAGDAAGAAAKQNEADQRNAQAGTLLAQAANEMPQKLLSASRDSMEIAKLQHLIATNTLKYATSVEARRAAQEALDTADKAVEGELVKYHDSLATLMDSKFRGAEWKARIAAGRASVRYDESVELGASDADQATAKAARNNADAAYRDAQMATKAAKAERRAARLLNPVAKARSELTNALDAAAYAAQEYEAGSREHTEALGRVDAARRGVVEAVEAENRAARETALTRIAPGDAVRVAQARLRNARANMADALKQGKSSEAYQGALRESIDAERGVIAAEQGIVQARVSLRQARATAAGLVVKSADIGIEIAKAELAVAKRNSGGRRTAEVINAEAAVVAAKATARDTALQYELDTIDFNKEMGFITGTEAVRALQEMLKAKDLTEQQRRDIMRKIKGLQDDIRNTLTGSGLNIPTEIKLPTAYEVRRSLGTDAARDAILASVVDVRKMQDAASTSLGAVGTPGGKGATAVLATQPTDPALVKAVAGVRDAVVANGAQQVYQDIDINQQVGNPAMIKAIVTEVVKVLERSARKAQRSNTSTPRTVR